jgi:hypothetical protein
MKLIRLPSGPLACVFPVEADTQRGSQRGKASGVYRAFSGSVEADGASESQAIEALDREVRRLSVPPPAEVTELELSRAAANDVSHWDGPGVADATGRHARYSEVDTLPAPAPASSSRR